MHAFGLCYFKVCPPPTLYSELWPLKKTYRGCIMIIPRSPSTVKCIVDGTLANRLGVKEDLTSSVPHATQQPLDDPTSADFNDPLLV